MTVKAIFSECSLQFWVDVVANLVERDTWNPCYWIADPDLEIQVKVRFPDVVFHSTLDAVRGIPPHEFVATGSATVDERLLRSLSPNESTIFTMMDRMDPGDSFTYQERVRLYHRQLTYWQEVLKRFEPDIVVFPQSPHLVYDYILYLLCRCTGIKTIMFERTGIPGLLFPVERFETGPNVIESKYQGYKEKPLDDTTQSIKLSSKVEDHLSTITGNDYLSAIPFSTKERLEALNRGLASGTLVRIVRKLRNWRRIPYYGGRYFRMKCGLNSTPAPPNYLKQIGKTIENSHMSGPEWRRYKGEANRKKRRLESYYNSLTGPIDLESPYVLVTLSYQPERTSSPMSGVYANSFLMVDLLSKTIPSGWQLYVKEHPLQLSGIRHGERSRTRWFYDDLVSLPNVKLVPFSMTQFALIDNAEAVATSAGTAGWEAVVRGKPALIFGNPWYLGCEGVFDAQTEETCRESLATIVAGYRVDREKVRLYVNVLEQVCFTGYVDSIEARSAGISNEENVLAITKALIKFCDRPAEEAPVLSR